MTVIELVVVLAVLAIGLGLSAANLSQWKPKTRAPNLAARAAVLAGRPYRSDSSAALFLPDGRAVGRGLDPFTGRPDGR